MSRQTHDLQDFMINVTHEMAREYARIQKRATEDPGTAGDQGEENWATLLRDWLPPSYQVVTKGRIIGHEGAAGPQVDVLVLDPTYPKRLLDKKLYLAGGVTAAFECKVTLKGHHIATVMKNSIEIRKLFPKRTGSPYKELHNRILYGLLAHSHHWRGNTAKPLENIGRHIREADAKYVKHPREMLDLICVSDLATWTASKIAWIRAHQDHPEWARRSIVEIFGPDGSATTSYVGHSKSTPGQNQTFTPIGTMLSYLLKRIAWEDPSARKLARYFYLARLPGSGGSATARDPGMRLWKEDIYSDTTLERIRSRSLVNGEFWHEWSVGFP